MDLIYFHLFNQILQQKSKLECKNAW